MGGRTLMSDAPCIPQEAILATQRAQAMARDSGGADVLISSPDPDALACGLAARELLFGPGTRVFCRDIGGVTAERFGHFPYPYDLIPISEFSRSGRPTVVLDASFPHQPNVGGPNFVPLS